MGPSSAATNFINIGERTNVTGSIKFRKLIEAGDYAAALAVDTAIQVLGGNGMTTEYGVATLLYTFTLGMVAASFTGLVLAVVGRGAAATKINLFFAINTLFSLGLLRGVGWAHDAWGTNGMLYTEALVGAAALVVFAVLAPRVRGAAVAAGE